ncbi:sensor histidine kinase [Paenibacillus thalictri]|uniref:sensor histidine kinase n=1 Tax=Paenibacillus thalictri TaxID=2527873 RepID=UPI0013EF1DBF|nr:histidine kinase [Paenibacillus thalictri]
MPVLLLSISAYYIMQSNIKDMMNKNNRNLLSQVQNHLERITDDIYSVNLTFSSNPEMIGMLNQVLQYNPNTNPNFTNYSTFIRSVLVTSVASRPYLYSIYIYSDNPNKSFMSSIGGMVTLDSYFDRSWFDSFLQHQQDKVQAWNNVRSFKPYEFEKKPTQVITFYMRFFYDQGLVVLNVSKDYMEKKIKELNLFPNQAIFVLNEDNQPILQSDADYLLSEADLKTIFNQNDSSGTVEINKELYYVTAVTSPQNNWKYVSMTPLSALYKDWIRLGQIMILLLSVSILICIVLALIMTRRTYNKVSTIMNVVKLAESGLPIPQLPYGVKDEYDLIIQNILKSYIEHNNLKTEMMEKQYQMKIMELLSLQGQMNPHFLFNTLKSIFWMSFQLTHSKNEVSLMIENLSNMLYYMIGKQQNHLVSFAEEIQMTKNYIEIEQIRYKDKFEVIWEYPDHVEKYYTMKLLLQPIVENCIFHGLAERKGCIKIKLIEGKDDLLLHITDNGAGMSRAYVNEINNKLRQKQEFTGHVGMYNSNRRLALAFGDSYGMTVRSKLGKGTSVTVRLPYKLTT